MKALAASRKTNLAIWVYFIVYLLINVICVCCHMVRLINNLPVTFMPPVFMLPLSFHAAL